MPSFAAVAAVAALAVPMTADGATGRPLPRACAEDAACWSWSTMGNHKRAIATRDGARHVVVGPCMFSRYAHGDHIDWAHTRHLRGDTRARQIGCKKIRPIDWRLLY